jgi:hypothetical protein
MINIYKNDGYTLFEAMISIIIIGILASVSIPSLQHISNRVNDQLLQSNLLSTIHLAEVEAQVRGIPMSICFSNTTLYCGGLTTDRLLIFMDEQGKGLVRDKGQIIASTHIHLHQGSILWRAYPRYRDFMHILPMHWLSTDNGMFWYCRALQKQPAFAIAVDKSGGSRVIYPVDGAIKDSRGRFLQC